MFSLPGLRCRRKRSEMMSQIFAECARRQMRAYISGSGSGARELRLRDRAKSAKISKNKTDDSKCRSARRKIINFDNKNCFALTRLSDVQQAANHFVRAPRRTNEPPTDLSGKRAPNSSEGRMATLHYDRTDTSRKQQLVCILSCLSSRTFQPKNERSLTKKHFCVFRKNLKSQKTLRILYFVIICELFQ